ncbi:MAG TPA: GNAT family N-acetyltransferase [Cyanobacteria bacterium UBA11149]|nr:GNAT family N-acetyltransferase [Cyanobacteria bacterium UBA11367]HBE56202.1 GNAT family N-acetyltransferase [Cyanobacteria bacterium UBA11366]HBK65980.1 GNAT family N-acetyltransferase [Cyanobacteria bacterium UBA11166]HBR75609.1 GNAT family N-acetyltransferase [Cyanobacteria bacterium UBA11159]HBS68473.1 GNAT family N-acetyltransferase [Cyanobacteria bacterium UBA11153]HBW90308.1 GNAT family N-acetyltransferase [Cyanobacteria bacterium UBA11149]HCA95427.1 GNAT family N-acetyltransferase 
MNISLILAQLADIDIILKFIKELYEHEDIRFDESRARNALSQLLQDNSLGYVWVIYGGDEAIGYLVLTFGYSLEFGGRDGLIDELYIRETYRGYGIGTIALEFVTEFCKSIEIKAIHLVVERKNNQAHSLYRKMGFKDCDRDIMTKWID